MKITVNGEECTIEPPCSVRQLVEQVGKCVSPCAVEVNRELVPLRNHDLHQVREGDVIEIVTLVGGG